MADIIQELIEMLGSSDRDVVRTSLVEDLGKTRDSRAIKPLIEALNDEEMLVRWNAIRALAGFGDAAVGPLLMALENKDRFRRRNAVQALSELGGGEVVDRLVRLLMFDESDPMVQIELVRALDKIGDKRAVEPLVTVLKVNNWEMRYRAIHALDHLGDPRAIEPLLEVMNDQDKDIQWAAYMAVESLKAISGDTHESAPSPMRQKPKDEWLKLGAEMLADRIVVAVEGELLYVTIEKFMGYIEGVISISRADVELDMKKCVFVDSFALSRLHALKKKLKTKGRNLLLSGLRPNVMAMFTATKLDQVFDVR